MPDRKAASHMTKRAKHRRVALAVLLAGIATGVAKSSLRMSVGSPVSLVRPRTRTYNGAIDCRAHIYIAHEHVLTLLHERAMER